MRVVAFTRDALPYAAGERAGFPDDQAKTLVDRGVAVYSDPAGPADQEAETGGTDDGQDGSSGETGPVTTTDATRAQAAADLIAKVDTEAFLAWSAEAKKLLGEGAPTKKAELLEALQALVGTPSAAS